MMPKSMTAKDRLRYRHLAELPTSRMTVDELAEYTELGDRAEREDSELIGGRAVSAKEEDRAFMRYLRNGDTSSMSRYEERVSSGWTTQNTDTANAYYTVPQGFWANLQVATKAYSGVGNDFKEVPTPNGRIMPWATLDPTTVTASIVGTELTQLSVASPYVFGTGQLNAWTYATNPVLVSVQALQDSEFALDNFLAERLGEQLGRAQAAHMVSGTGTGQPLGVVTSLNAKGSAGTVGSAISAVGGFVTLGTATSVTTFAGTSPTELTGQVLHPNTLIAMLQAVDPSYYPGARWYMNSTMAWNMRTVTDTSKRPLISFDNAFDAGTLQNNPDYNSNSPVARILGFDVVIDNNLPGLTASTTGGPIFGNLQKAMVRRVVKNAGVMRLDQRWADQLGVGYIAFQRMDARANDLRAAVTVKPAAT